MKIKYIYLQKENIKKTNRQTTDWGKIFTKYIYDKRLVSRISKEYLLILNVKKTNNPVEKWTKGLNRLYKERYING